jgi:Ca2+-transporting ATPase
MISTIKLPDGNYRMFMKGAPEVLLQWCSQIVVDDDAKQEHEARMTPEKEAVNSTITAFSGRSLRTTGFAYWDLTTWPSENGNRVDIVVDMVWLGLFGIQDPLQAGVSEAVYILQKAGIFVRMITGDNPLAAQSMARDCGIYTAGGGSNFSSAISFSAVSSVAKTAGVSTMYFR